MSDSGGITRCGQVATVLVFCLAIGACVGPALSSEDYRRKAVTSLEQVLATAAGVRIAVNAAVEDRSFPTATAVPMRTHEETASWVYTAFTTRQPPPGSDHVRETVEPVLSDAAALLAEIRIAANRSDTPRLRRLEGRLDDLTQRVERSLREVQP